jgi:hypothetical protein
MSFNVILKIILNKINFRNNNQSNNLFLLLDKKLNG